MTSGVGSGTNDGSGGLSGLLGGIVAGGGTQNPLIRVVLMMVGGDPEGGGGLRPLIARLTDGGLGDQARSWVAAGRNQPVSGKEITDALGADTMDRVAAATRMTREEAAAGVAATLPRVIDAFTPGGEVPDQREAHEAVRQLLAPPPPPPGAAHPAEHDQGNTEQQ